MRLLIRTLTCKTKEYEKYQYHPKLRGTHCRVEIIIKYFPSYHTTAPKTAFLSFCSEVFCFLYLFLSLSLYGRAYRVFRL